MPTSGDASRLPERPRGVLLDLDDTLCDHTLARDIRLRIAFGLAVEHVPAARRPDVDQLAEESLEIALHGDAHFADVLRPYGVTDCDAINAARTWFRTNRFHALELFDESLSVLRWLKASNPGRRLGIVTNGPADVQRDKVNHFDLERYVDAILISGEIGIEKPDMRIFTAMLDLLGVDAASSVMIGDSPEHDIAGGQEVGLATIWVNRAGCEWPSGDPQPTATITRLGELRNVID